MLLRVCRPSLLSLTSLLPPPASVLPAFPKQSDSCAPFDWPIVYSNPFPRFFPFFLRHLNLPSTPAMRYSLASSIILACLHSTALAAPTTSPSQLLFAAPEEVHTFACPTWKVRCVKDGKWPSGIVGDVSPCPQERRDGADEGTDWTEAVLLLRI